MVAAVFEKTIKECEAIEKKDVSENEMFIRKIMRAVILVYPDDYETSLDWLEALCVLAFGKKEV